MQELVLGTTGRSTSRLGYGCSSIMGGLSRRDSLRMFDAAYDAGIRHYDVAPLYGFGQAEACLGEFLATHPDCTVTTKYGLEAGAPNALKQTLRSLARPLLRAVPALKPKLKSAAPSVAAPAPRAPLSAMAAEASLQQSLRHLRTGRIDVFLLHEAEASDANDELLRVLTDAVQRGDIGAFGIGSDRHKVEAIYATHPAFCPVVQFEWSILDRPAPDWPSFRIHHRSLREHLDRLAVWVEANPAVRHDWSRAVGLDLAQKKLLASLMLKGALVMNPDSIILVSSKEPRRIASNVAIAEDRTLEAPARKLFELVQSKRKEVATA